MLHAPGLDGDGELEGLLPVYVLPPRLAGRTSFGFPKLGVYRARFLRETLEELGLELRARGSDLLLTYGRPAEIISELCRSYGINEVSYQFEVGTEETEEQRELERALSSLSPQPALRCVEGQTMYAPDRTPFGAGFEEMPDVFTNVRKTLEKTGTIVAPVPAPKQLPPPPDRRAEPAGIRLFESALELFSDAGVKQAEPDSRAAFRSRGGEEAAFERLQHYFWDTDALARYKYTRNGLLGADYSSKISAWLANGSLSPRSVYAEVKRYERERKKNVSTYWLVFELTWRDYFNFLMRKYPRDSFRLHGPMRRRLDWTQDHDVFDAWREGRTGEPFIDANMKEIALTGYMSNRGRQNVASYLARDLGIDWRMGAQWFESLLIDYDPASNYGNWTYNTGVGTDPRLDRYFSPKRQAEKYDPKGEHRDLWLS
jgi:deoxyribodipyrimidine photo-lyase